MDDSFVLNVTHVRHPGRGSGRKPIGTAPIEKMMKNKKSVIYISNEDQLCAARALVTVKTFRDLGCQHTTYCSLRQGRPVQGRLAKALHQAAGVPENPCGLSEICQFQDHLVDYQIVVVSVDHGYQIIFKGPHQP